MSIDSGGQLLKYAGDADKFPTTIINPGNEPVATVNSSNPAQFMSLASGTIGIFTATHLDAKLASGGAIVYTMINAVVGAPNTKGAHAQWGTGSVTFEAFSSDGTTNPLSFTRT